MAKTTQSVRDAFDLVSSIWEEVDKSTFGKQAEDGKVGDEEKKKDPEVAQSGQASAIENAKDQKGTAPVAKDESAKNTGKDADKPSAPGAVPTNKKNTQTDERHVAAISDADTDTPSNKTAMAQKVAQAERLSDAIVGILKTAAEEPAKETAAVDSLQKEAMDKGAEYAYYYYLGRKTRMEHEMELKEANIREDILQKVGGIEGLLDKVAAEDPGAVLPPEMAEAAAPAADEDGAALDQIAQVLSESGVTAEELEQMIQQISALKAAGMDDEQIMQALSELADEANQGAAGEGAPETAAQEAAESPAVEAAETPAQEASEHPEKTASIQKTAEQMRAGVEIAKAFLRNGGK